MILNYFNIEELANRIMEDSFRADYDSKLNQKTWLNQIANHTGKLNISLIDIPLLGLEELAFNIHLLPYYGSFLRRIINYILHKQKKLENYRLCKRNKSMICCTIKIFKEDFKIKYNIIGIEKPDNKKIEYKQKNI